MCLQISFPRGIYAAFQHCSDKNEDCTFERLVIEPLENGESVERFPELRRNRTFLNELLEELTADLKRPNRKLLTSYVCAWDDRIKGILHHGFRLGYAAGQSIMLEVDPPQT